MLQLVITSTLFLVMDRLEVGRSRECFPAGAGAEAEADTLYSTWSDTLLAFYN